MYIVYTQKYEYSTLHTHTHNHNHRRSDGIHHHKIIHQLGIYRFERTVSICTYIVSTLYELMYMFIYNKHLSCIHPYVFHLHNTLYIYTYYTG